MQEVSRLHWQPGQEIGEYLFTLKRKATYAKLGLKHVASLLAAQLPRDIRTRIKTELTGIDDSLEHAEAHKLITTLKSEMTEKGYALNKGNRNFDAVTKVAVIHPSDEEGDFSTEIYPRKWLTREDNLALGGADRISGQNGAKDTTSVADDIHGVSVQIRDAQLAEREVTF